MWHIARFVQYSIQLIFPINCICCGREDVWLCEPCLRQIPRLHEQLTAPAPLDGLTAATSYESRPVQTLIHLLKYHGVRDVAWPLALLVRRRLTSVDKNGLTDILYRTHDTVVIPVPLHTKRLRERGYNQSALLATLVAQHLSLPYRDDILQRNRWTTPQAQLNRAAREQNLKGAFTVLSTFKNLPKNVILIDDVATTASTLRTCAAALKAHGVQQVFGLVIASDRDG